MTVYSRLPLYVGVHFRPFHPILYSARHLLHSLTLLRPYRHGDWDILVHAMEKRLATPMYQLLIQKDATLVISDGGAINEYGYKRMLPGHQ
jgi:hypothetical protein